MALPVVQHHKAAAILAITIAVVSLGNCSPVPCQLPPNPSAKDVRNYQLCLRGELLRDEGLDLDVRDSDYDAALNSIPDLNDPDEDKFLDNLEDDEVQSFPGCIELLVDECRFLLNALETLEENIKNIGYHKRRKRSPSSLLLPYYPFKKRSAPNNEAEKLLAYHEWREKNGYGNAVGRWGRSMDGAVRSVMLPDDFTIDLHPRDPSQIESASDVTTKIKAKIQASRMKRASAVVSTDDVMSMIEEYKQWRQDHGYGKFTGRWGR